jgi:hypothetical protein
MKTNILLAIMALGLGACGSSTNTTTESLKTGTYNGGTDKVCGDISGVCVDVSNLATCERYSNNSSCNPALIVDNHFCKNQVYEYKCGSCGLFVGGGLYSGKYFSDCF